ncbi:hypothetical protein ACFX12_046825 [Malus domestica]
MVDLLSSCPRPLQGQDFLHTPQTSLLRLFFHDYVKLQALHQLHLQRQRRGAGGGATVHHLIHSPQQHRGAASRARETAFVASATKRMVRCAGRSSGSPRTSQLSLRHPARPILTNRAPHSRCWTVVPTLSSRRLNLHQLLLRIHQLQ